MILYDCVLKYLNLLEYNEYSQSTISDYKRLLLKFESWCDATGLSQIEDINSEHIENFLYSLKDKGPASKYKTIGVLETFFKYFVRTRLINSNPCSSIERPKIPKKVVDVLELSDRDKILEIARKQAESGIYQDVRNYCIIKFLFSTGVRREELAKIEVQDVNWATGDVLIHGKGNKERIVMVNPSLLADMKSLVSDESQGSESIFKISIRMISTILDKAMEKAGCKKKGRGVHATRKVFATNLYDKTGDIFLVAGSLGHENLATVQRYTQQSRERQRKGFMIAQEDL